MLCTHCKYWLSHLTPLFKTKVRDFWELVQIRLPYHWSRMIMWQQTSLLLAPSGSLSPASAQAESNTGHCTPQIWWTEDEQAVHLDYISNGTEEVHQSSIQIDDGSTVDQQQCPFKLQHWSWTRFNFYKIYLEYYLDFSCNFMYVSKLCLNFLYFSYIIVKSYFVLNK